MKKSLLMLWTLSLTMSLFVKTSSATVSPDAYTHTTLPVLSPEPRHYIKAAGEFKTAAIWWLPDYLRKNSSRTSDKSTGGNDPIRSCEAYGYKSSCPGGQGGEQVFVTSSLSCFKSCGCNANYRYNSSNCLPPYHLSGSSCNDGSGDKYNACTLNVEEACTGYSKDCPTGWEMQEDDKCPYDDSYGTCCNKCAGYNYAEIPEGYVEAGRCDSCAGIRYAIKENLCEGFTTCEYGGAVGAKTCKSGSTVKYSECKRCLFECTLSSCPAHTTCRYEECSGKYCATGCEVSYVDLENYWCNGALRCWWQ